MIEPVPGEVVQAAKDLFPPHNADLGSRMRPAGAPRIGEPFRDWRDFTDRVCRPWIDNDGLDNKADAWYSTLFAQMTHYYLAAALVMADNALRRYEASPNDSYEIVAVGLCPECGLHLSDCDRRHEC